MPWHCPACTTQIRHNPAEASPDPGARYRCHVCRLELQFDSGTRTLIVVPLEAEHEPERPASPRHKRRRREES